MSSNNFLQFFVTYMKISKGPSVEYYQNNKERLQIKTLERYQSHSKKEKEKKKQQCGCKRYKNITQDEKQKLVEYKKNVTD